MDADDLVKISELNDLQIGFRRVYLLSFEDIAVEAHYVVLPDVTGALVVEPFLVAGCTLDALVTILPDSALTDYGDWITGSDLIFGDDALDDDDELQSITAPYHNITICEDVAGLRIALKITATDATNSGVIGIKIDEVTP